MDPFSKLPSELIEAVLLYMEMATLAVCCLVSKQWNMAANNNVLWKQLCMRNHWSDVGRLNKYVDRLSFLSPLNRTAFENLCEWKKHYVLRNQIGNNWRLGNVRDFTLQPVCEMKYSNFTSKACDGCMVILGWKKGLISVIDLEKESQGFCIRVCSFGCTVEKVQVAGMHVVALHCSNILFVYTFNQNRTSLRLTWKLAVSESSISCDNATVMHMEQNVGALDVCFATDENYLIIKSSHQSIDVFKYPVNMREAVVKITWPKDSSLLSMCVMYDVVYFAVEVGRKKGAISLHAYSINSKSNLYVTFLELSDYEYDSCTLEASKLYVVFRFDVWSIVWERYTGKLLIHDRCRLFLNANANPRLIGVIIENYEYELEIIDTNFRNNDYFITTMGEAIAMYSDLCVTLNFDVGPTTTVKFCTTDSQRIDSLTLVGNSIDNFLYGDHTKLVFYCLENGCVVRSFIK